MKAKDITRGGLFLALAVILPQIFHLLGGAQLGRIFLPMHLPVFLAGMVVGPGAGFLVGVIAPVLSHLLTGMPALSPPVLFLMMVELPAYGLVAGYLYRNKEQSLFTALLAAMVGGRLTMAVSAPYFFAGGQFPITATAYVKGALVAGLPGLLLQLILIPVLLKNKALLIYLKRRAPIYRTPKE